MLKKLVLSMVFTFAFIAVFATNTPAEAQEERGEAFLEMVSGEQISFWSGSYMNETGTEQYFWQEWTIGGSVYSSDPILVAYPGIGESVLSLTVTQNILDACVNYSIPFYVEFFSSPNEDLSYPTIGMSTNVSSPCSKLTTFNPPFSTPRSCTSPFDAISIPPFGVGISVSDTNWTGDPNQRTLYYSALDSYVFPAGTQTVFTFTNSTGHCITDPLSPPTAMALCGQQTSADISIPDPPLYVLVISSGWTAEGIWTVTYAPVDFYSFPAGTQTEYVFTHQGDCETEQPLAPTWVEACGNPAENPVTVPDPPANVSVASSGWDNNGIWTVEYSADEFFKLPGTFQASYTFTHPGPCETEMPQPPTWVESCGVPADNPVSVPDAPENVIVTSSGWDNNGVWTVEYTAAEFYELPEAFQTSYTFTHPGPCVADPLEPPTQTEVCGADNDAIQMPTLPAGYELANDTLWVENSRSVSFGLLPGFSSESTLVHTFTDANNDCVVDPVGTDATIVFVTSDDGSIEGTTWQLWADGASQAAAVPFAEGVVGPNNTVVFTSLLAGDYRITLEAEGYERLDSLFTVLEGEPQEIRLEVAAIQIPPTPTPAPTVDPSPTPEPTAAPNPTSEPTVAPTVAPSPTPDPTAEPTVIPTAAPTAAPTTVVSGLPDTGNGTQVSGNTFVLVVASLALTTLTAIWLSKRGTSNHNM